MKPHASTAAPAEKSKLRFGLPGSAKERGERIKAAIKANRETLRRLAKWTLTVYLELGDYCEIAAERLGTSAEQIARQPRIALADSALGAPRAGFYLAFRASGCSFKVVKQEG